MYTHLLILGGTLEATQLCNRLADLNVKATLSMAGRVARPKAQRLPVRIGGFGGIAGLQTYLKREAITHVIDATHPFAAQMSTNAIRACEQSGVPLIALSRPPWRPVPGDTWDVVGDIAQAALTLNTAPKRVFLAVGRMHLDEFACVPQHHYILRLVDPPNRPLPLPSTTVLIDRGPFTVEQDTTLMRAHGIDLVVSKNAGGTGALAKITAARSLGLPVVMIDRPTLPKRHEAHRLDDVLDWLRAHGADLGV